MWRRRDGSSYFESVCVHSPRRWLWAGLSGNWVHIPKAVTASSPHSLRPNSLICPLFSSHQAPHLCPSSAPEGDYISDRSEECRESIRMRGNKEREWEMTDLNKRAGNNSRVGENVYTHNVCTEQFVANAQKHTHTSHACHLRGGRGKKSGREIHTTSLRLSPWSFLSRHRETNAHTEQRPCHFLRRLTFPSFFPVSPSALSDKISIPSIPLLVSALTTGQEVKTTGINEREKGRGRKMGTKEELR